jgi:hypothetical protein
VLQHKGVCWWQPALVNGTYVNDALPEASKHDGRDTCSAHVANTLHSNNENGSQLDSLSDMTTLQHK